MRERNTLANEVALLTGRRAPARSPRIKLAETGADVPAYPRLVLVRLGGEPFTQQVCARPTGHSRLNTALQYRCKGRQQLYLSDSGEFKPVQGYRSRLWLEIDDQTRVAYDAIERANRFRHLAEKEYIARMGYRVGHEDKQEIIVEGNVVIHAANYPCHLEGCIAPGNRTLNGVADSEKALQEINAGLGGWKLGKKVRVLVRGYREVPGKYDT